MRMLVMTMVVLVALAATAFAQAPAAGKKRTEVRDASGKVVEVQEQIEEKELPRPVAAAMHSHPRAIFVSATRVTRGTSVEYRITVRGTRKTAMVARPDGAVLSFK